MNERPTSNPAAQVQSGVNESVWSSWSLEGFYTVLNGIQPERSLERRVARRLFMRMTLPIVAVGVLLLASGIYSAWRVHRLHKRGTDILGENIASIRKAEGIQSAVRELRYRLKRFLSTGDERQLEEIARLLPEIRGTVADVDRLDETAGDQQVIRRIARGIDRFATEFERLRSELQSDSRRQRAGKLADEMVQDEILVLLQQYVALNDEQVDRNSRRNEATASRLMLGLLLLGTCGGVAGLLLGYGIARRVSRTIVELSFPLRDVAGKLNEAVGPVAIAADPGFKDLEAVLQIVSQRVSAVVERLQASERETLRAEQLAAMGQLAAGLAHEIRNPLTSMKTLVQLAETPRDLLPRDLEILKEEIARLEQSVQAFLEFARPPQAEKREVALGELLEQPAALLSRRARRQGVEFVYEPPCGDLRLVADAAQVRQVVLNLVLNAFDATTGGGSVRLEAAAGDGPAAAPADRHVLIRVTDTGAGLPEDLGGRIFEPFVSAKETGIGLGLSICRRIVEDHAGQITAENRPQGGGAAFVVRLPREPQLATLPPERES